jgi:pimeloyl-ACP methyl ester carboxylesterase
MNRRSFVAASAVASGSGLLTATANAQGTPESATPEAATPVSATPAADTLVKSGYAPVNGLQMYWEQHGTGAGLPIVLLHGGLSTIEWSNGPFMRELAKARTVYAIEFQSHGRTANIDRPFTLENLRDDVIAFIEHLELGTVDLVGFSLGATTAIGVAIARPDLINKLVPISGDHTGVLRQENQAAMGAFDIAQFEGSPMLEAYQAVAPNPDDFASTVANVSGVLQAFGGWPDADVAAYPAPTLLVICDTDAVPLDSALAFFRLRGGDVNADFVGLPATRLAILPGPGHFAFMSYVGPLVAIIEPWLAAPTA